MKKVFFTLVLMAVGLTFATVAGRGQNAVGEIAPHPLDGAFAKRPDNSIVNGLLNDPLFKKAVAEAAKAMREQEEIQRRTPKIAGPSPQRAGRAAFLRVINGEAEKVHPIIGEPQK